jgi:hypothetical protein
MNKKILILGLFFIANKPLLFNLDNIINSQEQIYDEEISKTEDSREEEEEEKETLKYLETLKLQISFLNTHEDLMKAISNYSKELQNQYYYKKITKKELDKKEAELKKDREEETKKYKEKTKEFAELISKREIHNKEKSNKKSQEFQKDD